MWCLQLAFAAAASTRASQVFSGIYVHFCFQLTLTIVRQTGGLGISIAGGKGSTPYKGDDEVSGCTGATSLQSPGALSCTRLPFLSREKSCLVSFRMCCVGHPRVTDQWVIIKQGLRSLRTISRAAELLPPQTGFLFPFSHASSGQQSPLSLACIVHELEPSQSLQTALLASRPAVLNIFGLFASSPEGRPELSL